MVKATKKPEIWEDVWIRTSCGMCYCGCAIRVRRINGVAVEVEGDPDSDTGARGGICGKGVSSLQYLYDPSRLNYPVRRTNPEKGIGVDPKWERISWDEALTEIAERLKKIHDDNPNKLVVFLSPSPGTGPIVALPLNLWINAFNTENVMTGGAGLHCGSAAHLGSGMNHCSWSTLPDFKYCNYAIYFGATKGTGAGHSAAMTTRLAADARSRGMKTVVFDPLFNHPGGKATEWIPLLPGTDLAVALAMANVIINELVIYDEEYIKKKTNGPYLVKQNGEYVRDPVTSQPLLWDLTNNETKTWDNPDIFDVDVALYGEREVDGIKCQPAFSIVGEHLKQYTPEWAEKITTVPATTIRRISKEFVEAASIGSTINIDGINLPFRPVATIMFRGGQGHSNGFHAYMAVNMLSQLVGAADVPGGVVGWPAKCNGYPGTGNPQFEPFAARDGFLRATMWPPALPGAWPHPEPIPANKHDSKISLQNIFSIAPFSMVPYVQESEELWQKLGLPYRLEAMLHIAGNPVMTVANPDTVTEQLKKIPFIASIVTMHNETTEALADIVLPDTSCLETLNWADAEAYWFSYPVGMEDWYWHIRQPVVEPQYERRHLLDTLTELADRLGLRKEWNSMINGYLMLLTHASPAQGPEEKLSWEEMVDKFVQVRFGPEHDLKWFKENGFISWPKKPDEAYWRWTINARASIYMEFLVGFNKRIHELCDPVDIPVDYDQFTPLLSYFPTVALESKDPECDLIAMSCRDVLHTATNTGGTPWLVEASKRNPYTYKVLMHTQTAHDKKLKDGDYIWIENDRGAKVKGLLHTIEGIQPQTIGVPAFGGRWTRAQPLARNQGICFNYLIPAEWGYNCPITMNIETSAKVKVYKAESGSEVL